MPSSYSTNLKIELQATGENSGTWGTITNTNLGTALEQAIVGYGNPSYASDANLTLTYTDTNAAQAARALVLNVTSAVSLTNTRELVVPTIQKQYIVQNNTTGSQSITVKTSGGTGITVPNGRKAHLYVNGTDVIYMDDYVDINGGAIDGTPIGANSASTGSFTTLGATTGNITTVNATTVDTTNIEVTNLKAKDGTAAGSIADSTGVVTLGSSVLTTTDINGGTIDGTTIGGSSAAAGTFTTLTTSSTVTLNGGTANGVLYLNGSKAATSGSALTFDGTNLNAGSATFPSGRVRLKQADDTTKQKGLIIEAAADDSILAVGYDGTCFTYNATYNTGGAYKPQAWWVSGSESMRLTSTGLGIGTSSPGSKFTVEGANTTDGPTNFLTNLRNSGTQTSGVGTGIAFSQKMSSFNAVLAVVEGVKENSTTDNYASALLFSTRLNGNNLAERMRLDSSGNLGLGVTPSAWDSASKGFQVSTTAAFAAYSSGTNQQALLLNNAYLSSTGYKYLASNYATYYQQQASNGTHAWFTAPSGTAGNAITFTQAMTLDASGNLGVGVTSPTVPIDVQSNSGGTGIVIRGRATANTGALRFYANDGTTQQAKFEANDTTVEVGSITNVPLVLYANGSERARITSDGNFGVGTTSPGVKLDVQAAGVAAKFVATNGNVNQVAFSNAANGTALFYMGAPTSDTLQFSNSAGTERARIHSGGSTSLGSGLALGSLSDVGSTFAIAGSVISAGAGTYPMKWNSTTGTVTYDTSSRFVKEKIQDSLYGLAEVMALKPRKYFRKDDQREEVGFVADEVCDVLPEFVPYVKKEIFTKNADDQELVPGGVNYDKLTAVLVKAIQELKAELDATKAEVAALKGA